MNEFNLGIIITLFPTREEVFKKINTSNDPTAKVWKKQVNKHNKGASVTALHSIILECLLDKIREVRIS